MQENMLHVGLLALASMGGAFLRLALVMMMKRCGIFSFPWGIFMVNMLGCFLFALVWTWSKRALGNTCADVILMGFLGAFTTFSTFIFDTYMLWQEKRIGAACMNVGGQMLGGFAVFCLGVYIAS